MITHIALAVLIYLTQEGGNGADVVDHECMAVLEYHASGEVTVHPTETCPGLTMAVCLADTTVLTPSTTPGVTRMTSLDVLGCATDLRSMVVDRPIVRAMRWIGGGL